MSTEEQVIIVDFIRDEFKQLHTRLDKFDIVFANHVTEDRDTREIALSTQQRLQSIQKTLYLLWGMTVSIVGLFIAWFKI